MDESWAVAERRQSEITFAPGYRAPCRLDLASEGISSKDVLRVPTG